MDPLIQRGVALITGAGSGMGQAMAIKFASRGCGKLFLVDLLESRLEETRAFVEETNKACEVVLHVANIADPSAVRNMVSTCVKNFGRLDFCMNNAGIARGGVKTGDISVEMFDANCLVKEKGAFLCQKYEIGQMLKQEPISTFHEAQYQDRDIRGAIVNTASLSGLITLSDFSGYASSKHGVTMMTKQLAREYAPHKIRVNSIYPGIVHTNIVAETGLTQEFLNGLSRQAPMNRWIHADEVAEATFFLCSSRASAITDGIDALRRRGTYINLAAWDEPVVVPFDAIDVERDHHSRVIESHRTRLQRYC
ncbi:hypothetical protein LTR93_010855 [Exophiala xenobiotica]|nr:hypothetical protein LTR93_010855 [Exophiala xenobiotica]